MVDNKSPKEIIIGNLLACGIEEGVVEAFVAALDPTFVTEVFHLVWDTCNEVNIHINRADIPTQWYDIYQCMLSLEQAELFDGAPTGNATVVHGHITDHPIYSTMAYQASWVDAQYRFFYVNLQFLLLCATVSARKTGEAMSDNAIIVSCLLTRQLVRSKHQDILIKLSSLFCNFEPQSGSELSPTIQRFYALNDYLIANKELKFYGAKLHALHTVIAIVVGDQNLKQKRERATGERGLVFREVYGDNEDTQLTIITDTTVDEETEYQSQVIDASAPNEVKSPRVQIKAALPANMPEAWVCSRQIAYRQKGMLNAISRRNQGLVYHVSRVQRGELRTILNNSDKALFALEETLQHGFATGFGEALDTQLGILLQLITGLPLANLLDITWVKDNATNQLHIKPITSKGRPMEIAISFVPAKHRLTKIKPEKFKPIVFQPSEYIELNVGDAFYALLKRAFRLKKLQGIVWQQPLLTTPLATLEQNINQQFKQWNKLDNGHMSIPRLMSWLDHAIFELTGDLAAGYYLSNNVNAHKPAQAYYANYDHAQLQSIYRQVTSKAFALNAVQPTTTPMSTADTTGSRLATIHRTMPNLVTNIAKSVGKADGVLLDKNIELHNRLVTYIYMMFAFGIGIRSVNDPLESINHLDMASGLMLLNDKENRSVTNCRYVFLPSILKQQIIAYKKHLNALLVAISGCALTLRQKVTAAIKGENNAPMLFFINSDRKVVEQVTPKKLTGRLKGIWPVPLNMGRHYLRSELGRRGCPAYWIDAMMGHAEIGVEANSKFSAMSFGTLKQLTDEYLEPLVKQGGWQILKGLGC